MSTSQSTVAHWKGYVLGSVHPNTQDYATFETKGGDGSGAGYERWRSYEYRPHTPGDRKEDVYVPVHRLLAVVECYPMDMPVGEILDDLRGRDVHHTTGVKWCNFGSSPALEDEEITGVDEDGDPKPGLEVLDHDRHLEITRQERLAWARDKKEAVEREESEPVDARECGGCGATDAGGATLARVEGVDGVWCLPCATERADGRPIEVL